MIDAAVQAVACSPLRLRSTRTAMLAAAASNSNAAHQSPSGWRFTTRVRCLIMNLPAGFSLTATSNAARARASERQIATSALVWLILKLLL